MELSIDVDRLFAPVTMQSLQRLFDEREMQRLQREEQKRQKEGHKKGNDGHSHGMNNSFGGSSAMQSTGDMFNSFR